MKKKNLLMIAVLFLSFNLAGFASAVKPPDTGAPAFEGTVTITPDNPTIYVGETLDLTAVWITDKDVSRYEWVVDDSSAGEVEIPEGGERTLGERTMTYDSTGVTPEDHIVCFSIWHHQQSDRYAEDCVTITVIDQTCTWYGETAWADGLPYNEDGRGNWATYTPYDVSGFDVPLYAGQFMEAGTVDFSEPENGYVVITITLAEGWRFIDSDENVKIQDYGSAPDGNPSPGQFDWQGEATGSSIEIEVPENDYYGVHVDVERCETEL